MGDLKISTHFYVIINIYLLIIFLVLWAILLSYLQCLSKHNTPLGQWSQKHTLFY